MGRSLRTLKGVGEKTEKLLEKAGIFSVEELLRYYPRNYDVYGEYCRFGRGDGESRLRCSVLRRLCKLCSE